jgi:hypothetical protein
MVIASQVSTMANAKKQRQVLLATRSAAATSRMANPKRRLRTAKPERTEEQKEFGSEGYIKIILEMAKK